MRICFVTSCQPQGSFHKIVILHIIIVIPYTNLILMLYIGSLMKKAFSFQQLLISTQKVPNLKSKPTRIIIYRMVFHEGLSMTTWKNDQTIFMFSLLCEYIMGGYNVFLFFLGEMSEHSCSKHTFRQLSIF